MRRFDVVTFVRALSEIYASNSSKPLGRVIAMVGAKGGVGSSTLSHNLAHTISREMAIETVIADMDLPYGTAGSTSTRTRLRASWKRPSIRVASTTT